MFKKGFVFKKGVVCFSSAVAPPCWAGHHRVEEFKAPPVFLRFQKERTKTVGEREGERNKSIV